MYYIYSIDPAPDGSEDKRLVEGFETLDDAQLVLNALEQVNILFHCYRIEKDELLPYQPYKVAELTKEEVLERLAVHSSSFEIKYPDTPVIPFKENKKG
ncbi:MAG: hypothetical protein EOM67_16920 [Spirochaetia bacterium]|nr:hypothetical protein [Spirochaetia bacterium]